MKPLLLALCCCLSHFAISQSDTIPPKKANTIILTTSMPDEDLYKRVGAYLLNAGYAVDRSDATLRSITTARRKMKGVNCALVVFASVNGGKVRLSGDFATEGLGGTLPVENRGANKSPAKVSFDALNKVATDLKAETSGQIQYLIQ